MKKLIYVCSPMRGNVEENIRKAREYCKFVIEQGHVPIAPHVSYYEILNDEIQQERNIALQIGLHLLKKCDELWIFGDTISKGMRGEINLADTIKIPVIEKHVEIKSEIEIEK